MKYILSGIFIVAVALTGCGKSDKSAVHSAADEAAAVMAQFKSAGDAEAGKKIVSEKCAVCHGMDGVLAGQGAPFIAGVKQDYLVNAMLAYADDTRKNERMKLIITELKTKPEQIANVAAYYTSLKTAWKGANVGEQTKKSLVSLSQDSVKAGASLAGRCNICHGANGSTSKNELIPQLAAMPPEYFIPALQSYFNGKRNNNMMQIFSSSISPQDIKLLAAYYAMQPPVNLQHPIKGDIKAGEREAGMCAGCHSIDGNALSPDIPSLAGQPAEYMVKVMHDYREGRRNNPLMSEALRTIKDQTIIDVAAYYASQKLESPLSKASQSANKFDPVADGHKIAGSCDGCHGKNGNSEKTGIPSLTGLNEKYLFSAIQSYRDGVRKNDIMKKMVAHLSDTDIEKVSFYYATQTPSAKMHASKADLKAGEKISSGCTSCHGAGGVSTAPKTPSLAGQDTNYLVSAIKSYASGARSNDNMASAAKGLKPEDIVNVAAYFSSLKAAKPDTILPPTPQYSIMQKCNRCHGENGKSTQAGIPSLAGQSEAYLALAIKEYQDGTRKNKFMNAMSDILSLVEIKAIAAYYARQ